MRSGGPTRVIAASLGLAAFSVALIAGLAADNPAETILMRAMVSMVVCHVLGWCVGLTAERAVTEAVSAYEQERSRIAVEGGVPAGGAEVKYVDSVGAT